MQFVSINAGCNVRTMVQGLAKQHRVSPSRISKIYQPMIFSEKNPSGNLIVEKPSGFHGGNQPFKISAKQTDLKKQLDEIGKKKDTYSDIIKRLLDQSKEAKQIA